MYRGPLAGRKPWKKALEGLIAISSLTVIRVRRASRLALLIQPTEDSVLPRGLANRVFDYLGDLGGNLILPSRAPSCASVPT